MHQGTTWQRRNREGRALPATDTVKSDMETDDSKEVGLRAAITAAITVEKSSSEDKMDSAKGSNKPSVTVGGDAAETVT